MASSKSMSARPPSVPGSDFNKDAFLSGAQGGGSGFPWETPEAQRLAGDKSSRKVVNVHFGYDYGLKLKFLRERGVNIHRFVLGAATRAIDEEIARHTEREEG